MLRGEDFRRRHDGNLVAVFDGNDGGLRGDDGFAAADVALQQPVHGKRLLHVVGDFLRDAPLRARRLKRQHGLDLLANAFRHFKRNAIGGPSLGALQSETALQPEELFKDQPHLGGRTKLH